MFGSVWNCCETVGLDIAGLGIMGLNIMGYRLGEAGQAEVTI